MVADCQFGIQARPYARESQDQFGDEAPVPGGQFTAAEFTMQNLIDPASALLGAGQDIIGCFADLIRDGAVPL